MSSRAHEPMQLGRIRELAAIGRKVTEEAPTESQRLIIPARCPRCGGRALRLDGDACAGCADRERSKRERIVAALESIPLEFRASSLELPPSWLDPSAVRTAREWLAGSGHLLTIAGPSTASGKTTLAGCVAHSSAVSMRPFRWIHAAELRADYHDPDVPRRHLQTIATSDRVLIDGLGKELGNADPSSGLAKMRLPVMQEAIGIIHERKNARFVVTVDVTSEAISAVYGDDAMRRIASARSGAVVIVLKRKDALDRARF